MNLGRRSFLVRPSLTVLRGKIVVENGKFFGDLKDGQYLYRRIAEEIRCGPAL